MATTRRATTSHWLTAARLTNAQWLAVSVFEDVIDLAGRIATTPTGAFGQASPARYHLPTAPLVLGSAAGALASTTSPDARRPMLLSTACTSAAAALTGYLIRTVNVPLLEGTASAERQVQLVGRWHRVNKARIGLLVLAGATLEWASAAQAANERGRRNACS